MENFLKCVILLNPEHSSVGAIVTPIRQRRGNGVGEELSNLLEVSSSHSRCPGMSAQVPKLPVLISSLENASLTQNKTILLFLPLPSFLSPTASEGMKK